MATSTFSVTVHSLGALTQLLSTPGVTVNLTPTPTPTITREHSTTKRPLPSHSIIYYRPSPYSQLRIDINATLRHHNLSRTDILSKKWKIGTWQNSVKRAMART